MRGDRSRIAPLYPREASVVYGSRVMCRATAARSGRLCFAADFGEELVEGFAHRVGEALRDRLRVGEEVAQLRGAGLDLLLVGVTLLAFGHGEERVLVEARDRG